MVPERINDIFIKMLWHFYHSVSDPIMTTVGKYEPSEFQLKNWPRKSDFIRRPELPPRVAGEARGELADQLGE